MKDISENQLLLPHFQRDFDWKPDKQKALIASFLYNIPIGSILLLKTKTSMHTKTIGYKKPNAKDSYNNENMFYLMDGQQRLTTIKGVFDDFFKDNEDKMFDELYHHLKNRWFLELRIFTEREKNIEESNLKIILDLIKKEEISDDKSISDVIGLIKNIQINKTKKSKLFHPFHPKVLKTEPSKFRSFLETKQYLALFLLLSTTERSEKSSKYKELLIDPTTKIFKEKWFEEVKKNANNRKIFESILKKYDMFFNLDKQEEIENTSKQWANDLYESLRYFLTERRKLLTIGYEDSFSKAVEAFTAMNKGGLPLSTFDIIVAKYAALKGKKLLLKERIENKFKEICDKELKMLPKIDTNKIFNHFLKDKDSETQKFYELYLNMLGIFSSNQNLQSDCIKEKNKLSLTKEDIDKNTDKAITSLALAFRFLSAYCGVKRIGKISYQLIVLPIAKNLYDRYNKGKFELKESDVFKILFWYWSSIFGGRYREKQNSRSIDDISILSEFLQPKTTKQAKNKIETITKKVLDDPGYSDLSALKQNETPSLKNPILQFIFVNKILKTNIKNSSQVIKNLQSNNLEESHLISKDDYKTKSKKVRIEKEHYINSVLNLAFLKKERNRSDRSKSWYEWNQKELKSDNILIPEKIKELNWDNFSKKAKNANKKNWEELCGNFIDSRFEKIKKTVNEQLTFFEKKWQ